MGMQKASGQWCVDLVEEFEKRQTDTISVGKEPITNRVLLLRAACVVVRQTSGKPQHPG
jgi:hypothetical protein